MTRDLPVGNSLRRSTHLGLALVKATMSRPAAPLKLNWCLTYWCQYRCKTCNIWQRKPTDELTTDEVLAFVRENPHVTWADLTGGEIFLRPDIDDIFADDSPSERRTSSLRSVAPPGNGSGGRGDVRVHLVIPKSFNDAQDVADKFKDSIPVILNLQGSDTDLSKRLIDFSSGLTYALDGGMQRIADKVFLLTPRNVEVSAEERARLIEKGFFNQS